MPIRLSDLKEENNRIQFTIAGINVSYINAIRRTILSDIPIVACKTSPHEENKAKIVVNTSRLTDEIVKQRLSCIPICLDPATLSVNHYELVVDVENNTDTMRIVTTKDFQIRDVMTDAYVEEGKRKQIFPPFVSPTGQEYYIEFLHLRPKLTDEIPGERIHLTCTFSVETAKTDSMFNVAGTCSYGCTPDREKMAEQLEIRKQKWKDEGKKEDEVKFEAANWKLLEGMRYILKDSFDFVLETVGIYDNQQLLHIACSILLKKLAVFKGQLEQDELKIRESDNTLDNSYDVVLENEDYTIGNILNYELYSVYYEERNLLNYVGFKKMHPHDNDSLLRISMVDKAEGITSVKTMLNAVLEEAARKLKEVRELFGDTK